MSASKIPNSAALLEEEKVKAILASDSSFQILAQRLKQSIKACEEFSTFIAKKCHCEQKYSKDVLRTVHHCDHSITSNNLVVSGSFIQSLQKVIKFDEKVNNVRDPYIIALQTMANQLESLVQHFTNLRKQLKEKGNRAEREVSDAINLAKKARNRYWNLCTELEKVRNSDRNQTKITLQGRKTNSQQEDDLKAKIKDAEDDYNKKANTSQRLKNSLVSSIRPRIANEFKNLIVELDFAMQIQLQKYSVYTESLIVGMGNQINPINGSDSMKQIATSSDLEKCLYYYLKGSTIRKNETLDPVEFTRHPIVGGLLPKPNSGASTLNKPKVTSPSHVNKIRDFSNASSTPSMVTGSTFAVPSTLHTESNDHSAGKIPSLPLSDSAMTSPSYSSLDPTRSPHLNGPRPLDPAMNDSNASFNDNSISFTADDSMNSSQIDLTGGLAPPTGKLFGVPLEMLDVNEEAVPLFVTKCINIIETFGTNFEGVYRLSANKNTFEELKDELDKNPHNLSLLDPKDPNNISSEYIYLVASLLKKFFASLPDPLLTNEQRDSYLQAAELPDKLERQTKMHQLVFELPDSNYFTLRDILGHFRRLIQLPRVRMDSKNISIVWANNLIGGDFESREELELQQKVIEDLIAFAPFIFTYDEDTE